MVMGEIAEEIENVVIGAGPGGYVAALRLGQLGKPVALVEQESLGGVCLNAGCIPSKALVHASEIVFEAKHSEKKGISAEKINVDFSKLNAWKKNGIEKLEKGIEVLCKKRNVEIIRGKAQLESNHCVRVTSQNECRTIEFRRAVLATGSMPATVPGIDFSNPCVMTSEQALKLGEIPRELVVLGAGYIGVELGTVFAKLGSQVSIVQRGARILTQTEEECALVVQERLKELGVHVFLDSQFRKIGNRNNRAVVEVQTPRERIELFADKVLVALGRKANTTGLGLENTKVQLDENGFVRINSQCQTSEPKIFAVGDITGPPLLAHRAFRMGKVCAEVLAGLPSALDNVAIPSVIFSDPEIAEVGLTEKEAEEKGFQTTIGRFEFRNLGKAVSINKALGFVKVVADQKTETILGIQLVGANVSEMVGEASLAIELGAQLEDLASTIHPHPTFSEALMEACEDALGKSVHQF